MVPILPSITEEETDNKLITGACNVPETVKLFLNNELSLTVKFPPTLRVPIVPKLVREELIKVFGKIVSFHVKNFGIETPIMVPTFPSILGTLTLIKFVMVL